MTPPPAPGRILGLVVEGFEVYYDPGTDQFAHAAGLFGTRRIVVGPRWLLLPPRQKWALLLHESAHLRAHHLLERILFATVALPLLWTPVGRWFGGRQELQADAFVCRRGYGVDMLQFLVCWPRGSDGDYYPGFARRTAAIEQRLRESEHDAAIA